MKCDNLSLLIFHERILIFHERRGIADNSQTTIQV